MSQDELEYEDEEFDDPETGNEQDEGPEGSYEEDDFEEGDFYDGDDDGQDAYFPPSDDNGSQNQRRGRYRDEIYSRRVPAGKRTYFFDVKTTRSGRDYFLTITESKKVGENRYEKHKLFLYKEDFGKFMSAMHEVVDYIREECLPDYEFRGLPEVLKQEGEQEDDWSDEGDSY